MIQSPYTLYKLMVLYLLRALPFPLTNTQLTDLFLEKNYTSYFHLQEVLSEMLEQGYLTSETKEHMTLYSMTPEGERTLSFFQNDISAEIRAELDAYLASHQTELRKKLETTADYNRTVEGSYIVHCEAKEGADPLIDLRLLAPSEDSAHTLARNWKKKSQEVYAAIMRVLSE